MISALAFGLVATAVLAQAADTNATFAPVLNPDVNVHNISNVVPATNVTLLYAANTTDASVSVSHIMKYPSILLEEIGSISDVTCSATEVVFTFNNATVLAALEVAWEADDSSFILITNHFGNCDAELQRGIFLTDDINCDSTTLVCTASGAMTDVQNTAAATAVDFSGLPATAISERTTISKSFKVGGTTALPVDTVLYSSSAVSVTADTASITAEASFGGYLYFNWLFLTLEQLYFDVNVDFSTNLDLSVKAASAASHTFSFATPGFTLSPIEIEGLFTVTPTIDLAIGAFVSASKAVDIESTLTVGVPNGALHLDLVKFSKTTSTGWTPTFDSDLSIDAQATAEFDPFVLIDINCDVDFSGVTLPAEVKVQGGFNNTISVTGSTDVGTGVASTTGTGACAQGLDLDTQFVFGIGVYLLGSLVETLYPVDVTLLDACLSW